MFDSITGTPIRNDSGKVVITVGGIGYLLSVPSRTEKELSAKKEATLYCHLAVKDDTLKLFGFMTSFERDLFLDITSVSGIGSATALNLLSDSPPQALIEAIATENIAQLQRTKGVGARTARRLALELKEKMKRLVQVGEGGATVFTPEGGPAEDVMRALQTLGYPRLRARDAAAKAIATCPDAEDLETLIKTALHNL